MLQSGMTLAQLESVNGFQNLDGISLHELLVPKMKKLEGLLADIYPQFIGIVNCALFLFRESMHSLISCPVHHIGYTSKVSLETHLKECSVCKEMLRVMTTDLVYYCTTGVSQWGPLQNLDGVSLHELLVPKMKKLSVYIPIFQPKHC